MRGMQIKRIDGYKMYRYFTPFGWSQWRYCVGSKTFLKTGG